MKIKSIVIKSKFKEQSLYEDRIYKQPKDLINHSDDEELKPTPKSEELKEKPILKRYKGEI